MSLSIQLTNAGQALMVAATGPIVIDTYKLGSQYGYVPSLSQINILGTEVRNGVPSAPIVEDGNSVRYSINLAADLGPFTFGEIGLFKGSILFAIGVFDLPATKLPLNTETDTGGNVVIDIHLPITDPNYAMWADVAQANTFKLNMVNGPHLLPRARGANPNLMMVKAPSSDYPGFMAYTDRNDLWEYEKFSKQGELTVLSATVSSFTVTAASAQAVLGTNGDFDDGEILLQFASGALVGHTRYCSRAINSSANVQLNLSVPVTVGPVAGDKVWVYKPRASGGSVSLARAADFPSTRDDIAVTPAYVALIAGGGSDTTDAFGS